MPTFVDQTKIEVQAGKGGDGMVAFRHEKYVPNGGPAGGDGGRGGSIIFVADSGLRTLMDFRYRRKFKADSGENGRIKSQYGRAAKDLYLKVPVGTTVYDYDTNELIGDLTEKGQELVVAKGGRGGRGLSRARGPRVRDLRDRHQVCRPLSRSRCPVLPPLSRVRRAGSRHGKAALRRGILRCHPR